MGAELVVGCMNFGGRTPESESRRIVERALERGLRLFDTANMYSQGRSERILGAALKGVSEVSIATKAGLFPRKGGVEGLSYQAVIAALEQSLERLGRDSVELLYLHAPDRSVPVEETLSAVKALLDSGRIKAFGVSNYAAWEALELVFACDRLQMPRPVASQVLMNLAIRQVELEHQRFAAKYGLKTVVYNPLAGGLFARRLAFDEAPPKGSRFDAQQRYRSRYWTGRLFAFADAIHALADESGLSGLDLAYGWLRQHPGVDAILAGPSSLAHVDQAVDACERPLSAELLAKITRLQREFDGSDASYAR